MGSDLFRTALYLEHLEKKARLVPFAGYEMPIQYRGVVEEHRCVRNHVGIFDVSHMGLACLEGPGALNFLDRCFTRSVSQLPSGHAAYTLFCEETGSCIDDLIIYAENPEKIYLVLNASNKDKDLAALETLLKKEPSSALTFKNYFSSWSILAIQGPQAPTLMKQMGWNSDWPEAFRFFPNLKMGTHEVHMAVTGYTGEKGCEIFIPNSQAVSFWKELFQKGESLGLQACGLGARDTLRTEMGYSLYGHELSESINPVEAGLSWAIGFNKTNFQGKDALLKAKQEGNRKLICLKNSSKQAPRPQMSVWDARGQKVGEITSGTYAPSLDYAIGMALVDKTALAPFSVEIRLQKIPFEECKRPFYKNQKS